MPSDTRDGHDDVVLASASSQNDIMASNLKGDPMKCDGDGSLHVSNSSLSNLTMSDPDIAMSSSSAAGSTSGSSRPPSSSGLVSPDLALPAPEDYTTETVDFHSSPQALKKKVGVSFAESESISYSSDITPSLSENDSNNSSTFNSPDIVSPPPSIIIRKDESEGGSDVEEEYFEEFHLPNTHENAFVRHQSFRRKVQLTPINAPDAKKIEDLVRTGELHRHGSIRRRITSDNDLPKLDSNYTFTFKEEMNEDGVTFEENIREIENMLNDANCNGEVDYQELPSMPSKAKSMSDLSTRYGSSTPKSMPGYKKMLDYTSGDLDVSLIEDGLENVPKDETLESNDTNASIEQITLMKIRDCLDVTKHKDLYNLSGRLQDILTPVEVEEVLNNSAKYAEYIDENILEALSNSLQEHHLDNFMISEENPAESTLKRSDSTLLERKRSIRVNRDGNKDGALEAIFVESDAKIPNLKTIKAPVVDFESPVVEDDLDQVPDQTDEPVASDDSIELVQTTEGELPQVRIVRSASQYGYDDESEMLANCSSFVESQEILSSDGERPKKLELNFATQMKRITVSEDILRSPVDDDNISVASSFSHHSDILSNQQPNILEYDQKVKPAPVIHAAAPEQEQDYDPVPTPPPYIIPELSAIEESMEERHWRTIVLGGVWRRIDMKVIAPYRKCVSHCGYAGESRNAIIQVSSCYLPNKSRRDYNYVMDNLFLYVISTLEQLISDDYVLVYLASGGSSNSGPGFQWLKKAYQMIDRKLRKNLKSLQVVHPTLWVRTVVAFSRPFISTKFYRKLSFVNNLTELAQIIPLDQLDIPDVVQQTDFELMIKEKKKNPRKCSAPPVLVR